MFSTFNIFRFTVVKQFFKPLSSYKSSLDMSRTNGNVTINSPELGEIIVVPQTNPNHTASVIFLHGSGDTGAGVKSWLELTLGTSLAFAHIQLLFPTAPLQNYTPLGGSKSNVWFDRKAISADVEEDKDSADIMAQKLYNFIEDELVANGTPYNRIIIGGFSMGGAMALHVIYRYCPQLAGVFTLSSFLNHDSKVYDDLKTRRKLAIDSLLPELYSWHGDRDELVPLRDGEGTFKKLTERGVEGEFHIAQGMHHEMLEEEIEKLFTWIKKKLPENYS